MKDTAAEFRMLGFYIDNPRELLNDSPLLFTDERRRVFDAMRQALNTYTDLSSEGVERFLGHPLPPEVELSRGAKPTALREKLHELALRRQLFEKSNEFGRAAGAPDLAGVSIQDLLKIEPISQSTDGYLEDGIQRMLFELRQKRSGTYRHIDTGIRQLNDMLGNEWPRQALSVVIAQPGGGKTALVLQSALSMARKGIPSLFFSLEMPKNRLISRLVANMANIDGMSLRTGEMNDEDMRKMDAALEELQSLPLYIVHDTAITTDRIASAVHYFKEQHDIEAFFVDYIQIVARSPTSSNDAEELGRITQALRDLALHEDIAGIALAQQNRGFTGLASVMGSGRISQIADTVVEIMMDAATGSPEARSAHFVFHKNRDGPVGARSGMYMAKHLRFE